MTMTISQQRRQGRACQVQRNVKPVKGTWVSPESAWDAADTNDIASLLWRSAVAAGEELAKVLSPAQFLKYFERHQMLAAGATSLLSIIKENLEQQARRQISIFRINRIIRHLRQDPI